MFRLFVWDTEKWEVADTQLTDFVKSGYLQKWANPAFQIFMERNTVHINHKWSHWHRDHVQWKEFPDEEIPSMVRMTAMLLR